MEYRRRPGALRRSAGSCRRRSLGGQKCRRDVSYRESTVRRLFERAKKRLCRLPANRSEYDHRRAEDLLRKLRQVDRVWISTARYTSVALYIVRWMCFVLNWIVPAIKCSRFACCIGVYWAVFQVAFSVQDTAICKVLIFVGHSTIYFVCKFFKYFAVSCHFYDGESRQRLRCNGAQRNAVPTPSICDSKRPLPQVVTRHSTSEWRNLNLNA